MSCRLCFKMSISDTVFFWSRNSMKFTIFILFCNFLILICFLISWKWNFDLYLIKKNTYEYYSFWYKNFNLKSQLFKNLTYFQKCFFICSICFCDIWDITSVIDTLWNHDIASQILRKWREKKKMITDL